MNGVSLQDSLDGYLTMTSLILNIYIYDTKRLKGLELSEVSRNYKLTSLEHY